MTAPGHTAASPVFDQAPPAPGAGGTAEVSAGPTLSAEERDRRRRAWVVSLAVLFIVTAATVGLLLMQWMASGSGTVAR